MTIEEENNVALLREGYTLWHESKAGSAEYWLNLLAEDVQWRSLADGADGAEFTCACDSKSAVVRYFSQMAEQWSMISYRADEFIAQGDRVVMLGECEWQNKATGKNVKTPKADVVRFRDGKIVDFMEYYDTAKLARAAAA